MKRLKFFLRKSAIEKELDSEIRFHLDAVIREKIAEGLSPEQARREALLEFGGGEQVKEACRDAHRLAFIETLLANLKSAVRFMRRSPGFSATVIATLALGIGANSAVFSAIDAVLLRPLPYPNPGELVVLHQYNRKKMHYAWPWQKCRAVATNASALTTSRDHNRTQPHRTGRSANCRRTMKMVTACSSEPNRYRRSMSLRHFATESRSTRRHPAHG